MTCISAEYIQQHTDSFYRISVEREVTSTNDIMKSFANEGAAEGEVLIAQYQTAGKGRLSRSFYSPKDSGIYMSVLLRPNLPVQDAVRITTSAAVAVRRAIISFTDEPVAIKWVNDIYMRDKKVCGILTESSVNVESGMLDYAVLGIGVNVTQPSGSFPDALKAIAGSVFEDFAPENIYDRLAAEILNQLKTVIDDPAAPEIVNEYRANSWLDGRCVDVIAGNESYPAKVIGVSDDFGLAVQTYSGERKVLTFGEVSVKSKISYLN